MEFKKLEIEHSESWLKRTLKSKHTKKTLISILIGAIAGFLYYYFTEGKNLDVFDSGLMVKSILIGAFFGFFVTNSPCARGKC